jgi:hypothetical protein
MGSKAHLDLITVYPFRKYKVRDRDRGSSCKIGGSASLNLFNPIFSSTPCATTSTSSQCVSAHSSLPSPPSSFQQTPTLLSLYSSPPKPQYPPQATAGSKCTSNPTTKALASESHSQRIPATIFRCRMRFFRMISTFHFITLILSLHWR